MWSTAIPIRIATFAGLLTTVGAVIYGIYALALFVFRPDLVVPGWTSIILLLLWLGGLQLVSLGIVGEYLLRIFHEVKNRPLYVVRRRVGFVTGAAMSEAGMPGILTDGDSRPRQPPS